jgi:hypothetical protein
MKTFYQTFNIFKFLKMKVYMHRFDDLAIGGVVDMVINILRHIMLTNN